MIAVLLLSAVFVGLGLLAGPWIALIVLLSLHVGVQLARAAHADG